MYTNQVVVYPKNPKGKKRLVKNFTEISNDDLGINSIHQVETCATVNLREFTRECSTDFSGVPSIYRKQFTARQLTVNN